MTHPLCRLTLVVLGFAALAVSNRALAEPSQLSQVEIYQSGDGDYHTYRIPSLLVTQKGTLLAFCEGRKNSRSDTGDIDLLLRRSYDGGDTWTPAQVVWDDAGNVCGNPCPVVDRETNTIWLLLTWNAGDTPEKKIQAGFGEKSRRVFVTHSTDDGRTWARPTNITAQVKEPEWTWYATGPGAGIQLALGPHRGRLVIPCDHKAMVDGELEYRSHVIYSDDHGKTWQLGGCTPQDDVNECEVVELADGRLLLNMRNYDRSVDARQVCFSDDGGLTWYDPGHDSTLVEPLCQASIRRFRMPQGDRPGVILFSNPATPDRRERMTIRASYDEGKTWPDARLVHAGGSAYSCLAKIDDDTIGCLYEKDGYQTITLARFGLDWVQGKSMRKPHVVYILADDLGYGDVACYNPQGKIPTPNIDRLAAGGIRFTDAHTNSSVCTPTRYGILTGRYAWRSRLKRSVLNGVSPPLIESGRMTLASLFRSQGYHTAMIGKWHLGWDYAFKTEARPPANPESFTYDSEEMPIDYAKPVTNGPDVCGFDDYLAICGSLDMNPYVYVENGRITAPPDRVTEDTGKRFWRKGLTGADFRHVEVLPKFVDRAVDVIRDSAKTDQPLLLYLALPAPHTPILPIERFQGATKTNAYGDFVAQCDYHVGQIVDALREANMLDDTLLVFTSDNGCSPMADFEELAAVGHDPSYVYRGNKADIYEGGHRVPYIVHWPHAVQPGRTSDETICVTDMLATCADLLQFELPDTAGEDSVSHLAILLGDTAEKPTREATVHHSFDGAFALRQGAWKLIFAPGSGGWSYPSPFGDEEILKTLPAMQLYNLDDDIGETKNLIDDQPEKVEKLTALMRRYVERGRSTPGAAQQNDGDTPFLPKTEQGRAGDSGIEFK